jgi:arrestin-related trafficking adapter 4/5/7
MILWSMGDGKAGSLMFDGGSICKQLPSYPSHIRDRIANMYLPDEAVLRVTNPWIHQGIRPVQQLEMDQDGGRHSNFTSGADTPLEAHYVSPPIGHGTSST